MPLCSPHSQVSFWALPRHPRAQAQRIDLSYQTPGKPVKAAFPAAQCLWELRFEDSMKLVDQLENGMKRGDAQAALTALKPSCADRIKAETTDGQLLTAIVFTQHKPRAQCIARHGGEAFARFARSIRKQKSDAAQQFIQTGFTADLDYAVRLCDPKLLVARNALRRGKLGEILFGWKLPYLIGRPYWISEKDCQRYEWRTQTCTAR